MNKKSFRNLTSTFKRTPLYKKITILVTIFILTGFTFSLFSNSAPARPASSDTSNASATPWLLETPTYAEVVTTPIPPNVIEPTITAAISRYDIAQTFIPLLALATNTQTVSNGISITQERKTRGDYLTVVASEGGYNYTIGPLAEGVYAIGPNNKFLVYITNNAVVYAAKIGETTLTEVGRLTMEFPAVKEGSYIFELSFHYNGSGYYLVIHEAKYNGNNSVLLPTYITN